MTHAAGVALGLCWAVVVHRIAVHGERAVRRHRRRRPSRGRERLRRRWRRRDAGEGRSGSLAEVIDLMIVAAAAGASMASILRAVRPRVHPAWVVPVSAAVDQLDLGVRLDMVLHDLFDPAGDRGHSTATALVEAVRDGTSLVTTLARVGDDARAEAARRAEIAARRLPVRLLFPLVLCILPAFVLTTVVPLLAGSLRALPR